MAFEAFPFLNRLPVFSSLQKDASELTQLIIQRRAPRIAAIGTEESGKTALCNALVHANPLPYDSASSETFTGRWVQIRAGHVAVDWFETTPERVHARSHETLRSFGRTAPDVLLLLVREGHIDEDAAKISEALEALFPADEPGRPKILSVLTLCDRAGDLPYEAKKKGPLHGSDASLETLAALDVATRAVKTAFDANGVVVPRAIPVSTADQQAQTADATSVGWNLPELAQSIFELLPDSARLEAARSLVVSNDERKELARRIVKHSSEVAVSVGLAPIPFSDAIILVPLQLTMVMSIAYIGGQAFEIRAVLEWLSSLGLMGGAAYGFRWSAQQVAKLVPAAGAVVSAGVAGTGTVAMGRSAIAYFIEGKGNRWSQRLLK